MILDIIFTIDFIIFNQQLIITGIKSILIFFMLIIVISDFTTTMN